MAVSTGMVSDPESESNSDGLGAEAAGGEPSDAEERLPPFQDVILFRRQQSLTADSLI